MKNNTQENTNRRVAIIGGGISGLATAYYLMTTVDAADNLDITLYESTDRIGGNCRTFQIDLGSDIQRWADMGVNDFNRTSYKKLDAIMASIGYSGSPLEDTELFYNNNLWYTNDGGNFTPMPPDVEKGFKNFLASAYPDFITGKYNDLSLEKYIQKKNDETKTDYYTAAFVNNNLYPRVNAMYFCPGDPKEMPFAGVMSYYGLQEGYSNTNEAPDRRYFSGGSQYWIDQLLKRLQDMATGNKKFQLKTSTTVTIDAVGTSPIVVENGRPIPYNTIVLATPAYEALNSVNKNLAFYGLLSPAINMFAYHNDDAIVHTDASAFALPVNSWRTYNVGIYPPGQPVPYTITYVANKHQNDAATGLRYGTPQFLIAMNPQTPINELCKVKQTNGQTTETKFNHQKLNMSSIKAQNKMKDLQNSGNNNLWFVNGYMIGAGLHEECLTLAENIAYRILGKTPPEQIYFDHTPGAKQVAPDYIVNAHVPYAGDHKDILKTFFARPEKDKSKA